MMDIEKPNCIGCHHIHPDNGNCTAVGGFCTAVPAAHCPLIPELRAENEKLRAELEKVKAERDEAEKEISHLKLVMRERGIYTIPAIYPWEKPEWNMP